MTEYEPEHIVPLVKGQYQYDNYEDDIFNSSKQLGRSIPDQMEIHPAPIKALAAFLDLAVFTLCVILFIAFSVFHDSKTWDTDDDRYRHACGGLVAGILIIHLIQAAVHIYHSRKASLGPSGIRLKFDMSWSRLATSILYSLFMILALLMIYDVHCFYMIALLLLTPLGICLALRQLLIINVTIFNMSGFRTPIRAFATATDTLLLIMSIPLALSVAFADESCSRFD